MNKSIIETAHILGISENQPVIVPILYNLVKQQAHFLSICIALFHVNFGSLKQLAKKSHNLFLHDF